MNKPPSALTSNGGLMSSGRFSRTYCKHCKGEELHQSMVCVQCKKGGIEVKYMEMHWNGKKRS
jgi:hypothetical protein